MNLAKFPRRVYTPFETPIEHLPRFSAALGNKVNIFIKRDDMLGLTMGGNKTRKLEFLMADALNHGADTIITCGAVQSNHWRLTLAAAVKEGFDCHLVLEERVEGSYNWDGSGNNFLYRLLGAKSYKIVPGGTDMMAAMESVAEALKAEGKRPYIIPGGGSNVIGALGYVSCAQEISNQLFHQRISIDEVVCASGSSGTHAGLLVGLEGTQMNMKLTGISVNRPKALQTDVVYKLACSTMDYLQMAPHLPKEKVIVHDQFVGKGYSLPTEGMVEAVHLLAKTENILLDPVYTGKAMAGLIDCVRNDYFTPHSNILFVHTGGAPALFAYEKVMYGETLDWNNR